LLLIFRFGQIVAKLGLAMPAVDDLGFAGYRSFECHTVSGPSSGDLVIVLPDDEASLAQASVYRAGRELLFFYKPHPPIPQWLDFVIASLHVAAGEFTLPDRWMDGSVTIWR
jgi:hypothetical protein